VAAADVGHRDPGLQFRLDAVQGGYPGGHQVGVVPRAEETFGAGEQAGAMLVPAHALAGPERLGDLRFVYEARGQDLKAAGHEGGALLLGQHHGLLRRQREPAGLFVIVDVAGRRLSGQPFADTPLMGPGAGRQFRGGGRAQGRQTLVEPEPVAQHHRGRGHRRAHVADDLSHECFEFRLIHHDAASR
jgi:hypothetical protein